MFHALVVGIIASCTFVQSSDIYCAWNRAAQPIAENIASTYNFLNGEFTRWNGSGTGDLWHGQPYYRMVITTCYLTNLYLYRYMDTTVFPPTFTWVIAANMGVKPIYGYAYCSVSSSAQSTPDGACDNQWMIGDPHVAAHTLDSYFYVQVGGCPQITCSTLVFNDSNGDDWAGTFSYYSPNIYRRFDNETSVSGEWFLFFNPKVWTWAINQEIDNGKYDECENYKLEKGFASVANVIPGAASNTIKSDGQFWNYTFSTGSVRIIYCKGTVSTPAPTAANTLEPTKAPISSAGNICDVPWSCAVSQSFVGNYLSVCGTCPYFWENCSPPWCAPAPTIALPRLTLSPTSPPMHPITVSPTTLSPTIHPSTVVPTTSLPTTSLPTTGIPTTGPNTPSSLVTTSHTSSYTTTASHTSVSNTPIDVFEDGANGCSVLKIVVVIGFVMNIS